MKFVGKNIRLKDRYSLEDFIQVITRIGYILQSSQKWEIAIYQNEIIQILTNVKNPKFWHRRKLKDILTGAGFVGKKETDKTINEIVLDLENAIQIISAMSNLSPKTVREEFSDKEIEFIFNEMQRLQLENYLHLFKLTHYTDYGKSLEESLGKIRSARRNKIPKIDPEPGTENVFRISNLTKVKK